jgi:molybdate transport system permease protein
LASRAFPIVLGALLLIALAFLTLPVAAIFLEAGPAELWEALGEESTLDALRLSLVCSLSALALIVVIGTPIAYLLATRRFRGRSVAITLIELPLVLPPAVAGLGLLVALGPEGFVGGLIDDAGIQLVFETAGVIVALTFVASPFYVRQAQAAFEAVDPAWLDAARTLGDSEMRSFARVAIPAASPGLVTGGALAWGRALGEFGATLVFAGSFQGVTQTAPLAIVELYGSDLTGALALAAVLVGVSAALLAAVKLTASGKGFGLVVD